MNFKNIKINSEVSSIWVLKCIFFSENFIQNITIQVKKKNFQKQNSIILSKSPNWEKHNCNRVFYSSNKTALTLKKKKKKKKKQKKKKNK